MPTTHNNHTRADKNDIAVSPPQPKTRRLTPSGWQDAQCAPLQKRQHRMSPPIRTLVGAAIGRPPTDGLRS